MEEAAELANTLPLSFKTPKEQEYIKFLWDAFEKNYTHGKYQLAFLAYHMPLTVTIAQYRTEDISIEAERCPVPRSRLGTNKGLRQVQAKK